MSQSTLFFTKLSH